MEIGSTEQKINVIADRMRLVIHASKVISASINSENNKKVRKNKNTIISRT
ncbi:hypothetical protein [Candidatus Liberibacter brunswickensis]|uniref:hypothetical protein n=1 Tax=Candidatus Liberibacter brunswickensis TaxID=1968796 RepID=UPI002FE19DFD